MAGVGIKSLFIRPSRGRAGSNVLVEDGTYRHVAYVTITVDDLIKSYISIDIVALLNVTFFGIVKLHTTLIIFISFILTHDYN